MNHASRADRAYFEVEEVDGRFDSKLFETLVGGEYDFYGVDNNCFCIGTNGTRLVLEAVENPDDGYRSYFGCFRTTEIKKIFFKKPIAKISLLMGGESTISYHCDEENKTEFEKKRLREENFSGWVLKDSSTGHVWLTIGTDYGEDCYPAFAFRYTPDTSNTIEGFEHEQNAQ